MSRRFNLPQPTPPHAAMRLALFVGLGLALTIGAVWTLSGQTDGGELVPPIDQEALQAMSPEERKAAVRAHMAARKAAIADGEAVGEPVYHPLDQPKAVDSPANVIPEVAGTTIQYDSGTVTGFITLAASNRAAVNRFDSALNAAGTAIVPVENTGTITMVTFEMLRTSFNQAVWSLYSDIMGTTANFRTDITVGVNVGLNTITVDTAMTPNNTYMNGSFLAGVFQLNTAFTRLGADTNSNGGQGFHANSINDVVGTGLNTLGNRNFVFRVTGNVVTPVELMDFEITQAPAEPQTDN